MYPFLRDTAPAGVAEFRDFGLDNFASGVLFKCDMPAAMMEPLLMSHPAEAALLITPVMSDPTAGTINEDCNDYSCRRGQIAQAIFQGTLNYFSNQSAAAMHVAAIDMFYEQKRAMYFVNSVVTIHDSTGQPVSFAEVAIKFEQPDGSPTVYTAVTGGDGSAVFRIRSKATGTYQSTVTGVAKSGWNYDSAANAESSAQLIIP